MMILCAGCSIWRHRESAGAGMRGVKTGIWFSASWRSCSPDGLRTDSCWNCARTNGAAFTPQAARIPPHPSGLGPPKESCPRFALKSQTHFLTFVEFHLHKIFCHADARKYARIFPWWRLSVSAASFIGCSRQRRIQEYNPSKAFAASSSV